MSEGNAPTHEDIWRSIGRHARKHGTALKTVLTGNPKFDPYIREGWMEADQQQARPPRPPPPFSTDLFGNRLGKAKR